MATFFASRTAYGLRLDPRTKLAILVMTSIFVLGGAGGNDPIMMGIRPFLVLISVGLLVNARQYAHVFLSIAIYALCYALQFFALPHITGFPNFLILMLTAIITQIIPTFLAAQYLVSTTTVSELVAGLQKLHLSEKIIIPISVIFRFLPAVLEEARHIKYAMRMRGIRFGGGKLSKMLEYRLIPVLTSSVKIGEDLSAAALTRGLGAPVKRTNICKIGFHIQDVALLIFFLLIILFYCLQLLGYTR